MPAGSAFSRPVIGVGVELAEEHALEPPPRPVLSPGPLPSHGPGWRRTPTGRVSTSTVTLARHRGLARALRVGDRQEAPSGRSSFRPQAAPL